MSHHIVGTGFVGNSSRTALLLFALLASACSKDNPGPVTPTGGTGGAEPGADGGTPSSKGGAGGGENRAGMGGRGSSGASGRGGSGQGAGASGGEAQGGTPGQSGQGGRAATAGTAGAGPGRGGGPTACEGSAFCDGFDTVAASKGPRAGELDASRWSVGRVAPQLPTDDECAICAGKATITSCRSGVNGKVLPDQDTLVCDPNSNIGSNHLLTAVSSQNYGVNSYRIRQPFDFKARTGTVVFDVETFTEGTLLGWSSLVISELPTPTPSFTNSEYGPLPKNAISIEFIPCEASERIGVGEVRTFQNYVQTQLEPSFAVEGDDCLIAQKGRLNHVEVSISRTKLEVYASDASTDGTTYPKFRRIYATDIDLPFDRGYVSITARNHATLKYTDEGADSVDAWVVRWDNVGFDGPVVSNWREYSVPNSLDPIAGGEMVNIGYRVTEGESSPLRLSLSGVDPAGAASAKLAFTSYYQTCADSGCNEADYTLRYRVNGGAWHDRKLEAAEVTALKLEDQQGCMNQTIDLDVAELKSGANTIEFATRDVNTSYPVAIANVDLILSTP